MRNYIIINGINSLTIPGLAIKILPPISKPMMRYMREEIDGRDGDINTELGYQAYDRPLEVGLFGDYDINQVIAFFNSQGKITFSDEPDKFYNFQILEKIDFTKLVKFRTATVNIHCQPFKYPVSEEPQEEEYEYVEATGTNVTLDNTSEAIFNKIDLLGNTSQNGTPTPSSPIPVNVVSGDNEIQVCGKNLFNANEVQIGKAWNGTNNSARAVIIMPVEQNVPYTISMNGNNTMEGIYVSYSAKTLEENYINGVGLSQITTFPRTYTSSTKYIILQFNKSSVSLSDIENLKLQVEKGSTASTYEPYQGNTYNIDLPVENLFDGVLELGGYSNGGKYNNSDNYRNANIIQVNPNTTYTFSINGTKQKYVIITYGSTQNFKQEILNDTGTFTTASDVYYINFRSYASDFTSDYANLKVQLEKGTKANSYTPYGTTPIELCKIGNYQDYFYKDSGKWYLHKEIGKIDISNYNNTEPAGAWSGFEPNGNICMVYNNTGVKITPIRNDVLSNKFTPQAESMWNGMRTGIQSYANDSKIVIGTTIAEVEEYAGTTLNVNNYIGYFKAYIISLKPDIYIILATPTNTEITDTNLIEQLEAIKNAISYKGQTNITQTNNDLPFILDLSALELGSDHLVINNQGNIYSKPTLELEGSGIVDIYLNDNQILEADLTEAGEIVIDTEAMEATNPSTGLLANRQVTGDYSRIKLDPGENDLRFSGDLTKATITNYERWL